MIGAELFRNFLTIYREGSVSAAARVRHLTQSAVSQQLSTLEATLGAPLFQRTVRGMHPGHHRRFVILKLRIIGQVLGEMPQ